eukprot:gnl/MRDRNA2_/MRDRNA2_334540_c0_seq1.p2 gnl/MRDRNA2_/MRDRNA2_334540_c0~~gnl/MRDRNA2_/MRDRNA2_334540_c0_seq1.p2  ORF type:complete len:106 (+),score=13.99 gnl/MRDRNA2_/MRDRNA2_334540_c0_seq1:104-421(+)
MVGVCLKAGPHYDCQGDGSTLCTGLPHASSCQTRQYHAGQGEGQLARQSGQGIASLAEKESGRHNASKKPDAQTYLNASRQLHLHGAQWMPTKLCFQIRESSNSD